MIFCYWRIFSKAGYPGVLSLLMLVPLANFILFIWFAFDYFMAVPWPPTLVGQWFPLLKAIPSV